MTVIGIDGGFSRDHLVNTEHGARFGVAGGPGLYATLSSALTLRWLEADRLPDAEREGHVRVFGAGADRPMERVLSRHGVDTRWLRLGATPRLWILTSEAGRRIVSAERTTGHELKVDGVSATAEPIPPADFLTDVDAMLRCAPHGDIDIDPRTLVAVDPDQRQIATQGWAYLEALARTATLFLPSRVQLSQLHPDPLTAATMLRDRTGRAVIARCDADGSWVLPQTGETWHVGAAPAAVIDTTGAGDSHAAAALTALALQPERIDLVRAASIASVIAARTVAGWGPEGLRDVDVAELGDVDAAITGIPVNERPKGLLT